ncbi:MAG: hypothetical protein R6W06_07870 [Prochlorococcaceae cyanobacterium]
MLFPFGPCATGCGDGADASPWRHHQAHKLRMLRFWRDGAERQLAALDAAISTLERQMQRDSTAD